MRSITDWARGHDTASKPWLLLGKGPSYERIVDVQLDDFFVCSLNHVVRELPVKLAHMIDIDVVVDCATAIEHNADYLVLPWHPHVHCYASPKTLDAFLDEIPLLKALDVESRLLCYNLSSGSNYDQYPGTPAIKVKYFSAEAALNVLVESGARTVRSLGVDGGAEYGSSFSDLESKTLFVNTRTSFDEQFETIAETLRSTKTFYAPLHVEAPIPIFVGAPRGYRLPALVAAFSVIKHASMSVEINIVGEDDLRSDVVDETKLQFGRSLAPLLVPERQNYTGRALFVEPTSPVMSDLTALWAWAVDEPRVAREPSEQVLCEGEQFGVLAIECELGPQQRDRIRTLLRKSSFDPDAFLRELSAIQLHIPAGLERCGRNEQRTGVAAKPKVIRWSGPQHAPWISSPKNMTARTWVAYLKQAVSEGFVTPEVLYEEVRAGRVNPRLPRWAGLPNPASYLQLQTRWLLLRPGG